MPLVEVWSGQRVEVEDRGNGKPILFVHGWPASGKVWRHQLDGLAGEHRVLAVDLPGFGESPPPRERPTMRLYAATVKGLIEALGLDDVFLVGWSMGAGVTMSYCEQFGSHRLRAVGIVDDCPRLLPADDWILGVDTPWSGADLEDWIARFPAEREALLRDFTPTEFKDPARHAADVEFLIAEGMKADAVAAVDAARDVFPLDFRPGLARLDVPALLLYGAHSNLTMRTTGPSMAELIPHATLVVFDESGHNLMLEEPERFNRVVGEFARSV